MIMFPALALFLSLLLVSNCATFQQNPLGSGKADPVVPTITISKVIYTSDDESLNLPCRKWNKDTTVQFHFLKGEDKELIFDSKNENVEDTFKADFEINPEKDGLKINVTKKLYEKGIICTVDGTPSSSVVLRRITAMPVLNTDSTKLEKDMKIDCQFELEPATDYSIYVNFYADDKLIAKFTRLDKSLVPGNTFAPLCPYEDFTCTGEFNNDYRFTLSKKGDKTVERKLYCEVQSLQVAGNTYKSESVTINPKENSAGSTMVSLSLMILSIVSYMICL